MNEGGEDFDKNIVNKVTILETGVIWVKPCLNDKHINNYATRHWFFFNFNVVREFR